MKGLILYGPDPNMPNRGASFVKIMEYVAQKRKTIPYKVSEK